jgi:hypothetical protein
MRKESREEKKEKKKKGKRKKKREHENRNRNHEVKGNQVSWLEMERGMKKVPIVGQQAAALAMVESFQKTDVEIEGEKREKERRKKSNEQGGSLSFCFSSMPEGI